MNLRILNQLKKKGVALLIMTDACTNWNVDLILSGNMRYRYFEPCEVWLVAMFVTSFYAR